MDHIKGQVPDEAWGNYYEPFSAFLRERGDLQLIQMEARDYGRRVQRRGWERLLPEGLILLGYRGIIAHGMYVPQENPNSIDDKDVMGVFVAPYTVPPQLEMEC